LKNLVQRTISGIVYLIVIIGALFLGKYTFATVFLITGLIALWEFYSIMDLKGNSAFTLAGILSGAGLFMISFLIASRFAGFQYLSFFTAVPVLLLGMSLFIQKGDSITEACKILAGILYIFIPLSLMNYLVFPGFTGNVYTHRIVLGLLILVWINDTGAYVIGSSFGRHRLFSRISPKKSWEGFFGGTIVTIVTAFFMVDIMGVLELRDWLVFAVIVSVLGVFGDLTESLIKRNAGIKDSGSIMPGHGGVLDRIDSLLFVIPAAFIYMVVQGN
jgi:phosphatidate cytidylyltransferase